MNKRIAFPLAAVLLLSAFGGCNSQEIAVSTAPAASPPEAVASVTEATTEAAPIETEPAESAVPNVLDGILECGVEDVYSFSYYDTPELYIGENRAPFPTNGAQDITYNISFDDRVYAPTEAAYVREIAEALANYRLTGASEDVVGKPPLPTGEYFIVWPDLTVDWNPILTFYDTGEVFIDYNGRDEAHKVWRAEDPAQFGVLKAALDGIHDELDALPLDYQLEFWLDLDSFKPESPGLRFMFNNIGADPVTTKTFLLERWDAVGGAWNTVAEADASDLTVEPRGYTRYAVDLTKLPGAQEPGKYRVTDSLERNSMRKESLPLELFYAIREDADRISQLLPPKMTPENQDYCDRYVSAWAVSSLFWDVDEEHYISEFRTQSLYYVMASKEGKIDEYQELYGTDVPAEIVEGTIMRHFLFSAEEIRTQTGTKAQNSSEYYDADTNSYHFEGGYGGGSLRAVVTDNRREGALLTMTFDWYGMDDSYQFSEELTVRLGEGENDFVYVAGRML